MSRLMNHLEQSLIENLKEAKFTQCLGTPLTPHESYIAKSFFEDGMTKGFNDGFVSCLLGFACVVVVGGISFFVYDKCSSKRK